MKSSQLPSCVILMLSIAVFYHARAVHGATAAAISSANMSQVNAPAVNHPALSASMLPVKLAWDNTSDNATGISIERKTGPKGAWAQIDVVGCEVSSYSDTPPSPGTKYYYRVRYSSEAGYSDYSNEASAIASSVNSNTISGDVKLWDISGAYSCNIGSSGELDFSIVEDPSGKFTGSGTLNSDDGSGNVLNGTATITGALKSLDTAVIASMTICATGSGTAAVGRASTVHHVTFTRTIRFNGEIDATNGNLSITDGSVGTKDIDLATGKKFGKFTKLATGESLALPSDATGDWDLTLNLTPVGTKYTGFATFQTSTGGTVDFNASGSFSPKTNSSKITLKIVGGKLTSFVILTAGSNNSVQSLKGRLFGQSLIQGQ